MGWAIRFAAETGLRLGDLIRVPWGAVGLQGIVWKTGKKKRQVVVPLTPAAKALIKEMPKRALTVLANSRGEPWTEGGLKHMIREARIAAGITGLRLHDLRGTAATRLFLAGSPKRDIATIMAWKEETVDSLLTKYVSGDAVALDLLSRMNQKPAPQTDHKPVPAANT
ncbi:tyrosine-type recombinase/integrase [Brevundimonas sp. TWP2-3-4b1]|uniref:tyrosine-type recombinase/integrase n=1 Tax=Brevundimonas sp. TWP2-3-4b1 TaxID=2804580 RepID=UPI003CF8CAC2